MNTFPFLSIYFFSHFSPWAKMGLDPPPPIEEEETTIQYVIKLWTDKGVFELHMVGTEFSEVVVV